MLSREKKVKEVIDTIPTIVEEEPKSIEELREVKELESLHEKLDDFRNRNSPQYRLEKARRRMLYNQVGTRVDEKTAYELSQEGYEVIANTPQGSKHSQWIITKLPVDRDDVP